MNQAFNLSGKVAIITGASKGIGESIARYYAEAGAKVVVSSRKQEAVEAVAEDYRQKGWEATAIAANTGKEEEVKALVEKTLATYGAIDIIVNNAGTNITGGKLFDAEMPAFDKMMDVNLKGPLWLSRYAYPSLQASAAGRIINIASIEGLQPSNGLGVYSITKAALIMMTKVLARELGSDNIRVNAICPGYIPTKLTASIMEDEQAKAAILGKQAIPYQSRPEDIASIALLMASDAGNFMSGSIVTADAGFTV